MPEQIKHELPDSSCSLASRKPQLELREERHCQAEPMKGRAGRGHVSSILGKRLRGVKGQSEGKQEE